VGFRHGFSPVQALSACFSKRHLEKWSEYLQYQQILEDPIWSILVMFDIVRFIVISGQVNINKFFAEGQNEVLGFVLYQFQD
jgi:hypothetical protein